MSSRCEFQTPRDREMNGLQWRLGVLERQVGGDVKRVSTSALTDEEAEVWRWEIIKVIQQVIDIARPGAKEREEMNFSKWYRAPGSTLLESTFSTIDQRQ